MKKDYQVTVDEEEAAEAAIDGEDQKRILRSRLEAVSHLQQIRSQQNHSSSGSKPFSRSVRHAGR